MRIDAVAPKIDIDGSGLKEGRLFPETRQVRIQYDFVVTVAALTACTIPVAVTFTQTAPPSYATVTLVPTSHTQAFEGDSNPYVAANPKTKTYTTTMTVQLTRDAPAFKGISFEITAKAKAGVGTNDKCTLKESDPVKSSAPIVPDYMARVQYQPKAYSQNSGQNKQVVFAITMINFSNGPTRVKTTIVEKTKGLDGILPPVDTLLESKPFNGPQARDTQEIFITARTPHSNGYTNKVYVFEANFLGQADTSTQAGQLAEDTKSVTLSVKVQGVYVPGFDPTSAVAALGLAVFALGVARRRNED